MLGAAQRDERETHQAMSETGKPTSTLFLAYSARLVGTALGAALALSGCTDQRCGADCSGSSPDSSATGLDGSPADGSGPDGGPGDGNVRDGAAADDAAPDASQLDASTSGPPEGGCVGDPDADPPDADPPDADPPDADPPDADPPDADPPDGGDAWRCGDALVDQRDGKSYTTAVHGGLCWMTTNLDVGAQLSTAQQQTNQGQIDKYCYNNEAAQCALYGGLYQWNEAMQYSTTPGATGICPAGFRVPTDAEWKALEMAYGMTQADADTEGWRGPSVGTALKAGGSSGFGALLGGAVESYGYSVNGPSYGYYWTSSLGTAYPFRRCFTSATYYPPDTVGRWQSWPASYALSVRCVKSE
jgi:uncharacterized protein (TIGR02145 family)